PGWVGIFAIADGHAFGGTSEEIRSGEDKTGIAVRLTSPGTIEGKVLNHVGDPVEGARISRVLIVGDRKVGIPLAKLEAAGFSEPRTDEKGRFVVGRMPKDAGIVLKVTHPDYAQEETDSVRVGDKRVRITLDPGVFLHGAVYSQDGQEPVANAVVVVKNQRPPHGTALAPTGKAGEFALRLKPGDYGYQAAAAMGRSPGWRELTVTGEEPEQRVILYVVGVGRICGKACDAVTGAPITGARFELVANGNRADVVRTGTSGEFAFTTTEGENAVLLESAPGYLLPQQRSYRVNVVEGKAAELPVFWMAPIPPRTVQIVDIDGDPVPGAIVTVLRPAQGNWLVTDAEGRVELTFDALPTQGNVVAMAQHRAEPVGALFGVDPEGDQPATAMLLPWATVRGTVVTDKGKPLEGVVVGAAIADEQASEPMLHWRTISRKDGSYAWRSVAPIPQKCIAVESTGATGESASFAPQSGETKVIGNLVVAGGEKILGLYGKILKWFDNAQSCGVQIDKAARQSKAAVVVYCSPQEAEGVIECVVAAHNILADDRVIFAVIVDGHFVRDGVPIPIFSGKPPGPATTYVVGLDGRVVLETFGLPPLNVLQELHAD
ncbi:MAG TPA: hypothetical protein HPP77_04690, partial [Candidatus Hydrogenedentes bacterium]|nr:hypothetical protein [Candidatus Hydrogenedentota bacterium]